MTGGVFDTAALRQASEMVLPDDPRRQRQLWAQNSSDLVAAADYICRLEAGLAEWKHAASGVTGYCARCEAAEARVAELEASKAYLIERCETAEAEVARLRDALTLLGEYAFEGDGTAQIVRAALAKEEA